MKKEPKMDWEEFENQETNGEAYPEEMLIACQNGTPCSYGICDECPNTLGKDRRDEENE